MITRAVLDERVREWGLRDDVVEKDYVLGWLLWGIGTSASLRDSWIFKGGTCLKKCYIETYRFSEDLDFTVLPGGPISAEDVLPLISEAMANVHEASGIDFSVQEPRVRLRPGGRTAEGRVYYRGPRGAPAPARIKLDLSADEALARPPVLRSIAHAYPDELPAPAQVRCYAFEELFAEKIRAMGERSRPRDLYDIVNLFRREDLRLEQALIHSTLERKCESKGIELPTHDAIDSSPLRVELESEWENMLGHQLPVLPPFEQFWEEAEVPLPVAGGQRSRGAGRGDRLEREGGPDLVPATHAGDVGSGFARGGALRRRQPPARGARLQRQHSLDRALLAATQQRRRPAAPSESKPRPAKSAATESTESSPSKPPPSRSGRCTRSSSAPREICPLPWCDDGRVFRGSGPADHPHPAPVRLT